MFHLSSIVTRMYKRKGSIRSHDFLYMDRGDSMFSGFRMGLNITQSESAGCQTLTKSQKHGISPIHRGGSYVPTFKLVSDYFTGLSLVQ